MTTNTAASVRARLTNQAKARHRPFQEVLQHYPEAEERDYPTLLDLPAPHLRMYPRETVVAEKFEAMVQVSCWGSNEFGEAEPPARPMLSISAGSSATCGLNEDVQIECWGAFVRPLQ